MADRNGTIRERVPGASDAATEATAAAGGASAPAPRRDMSHVPGSYVAEVQVGTMPAVPAVLRDEGSCTQQLGDAATRSHMITYRKLTR